MERRFPRKISSLDSIFRFVADFFATQGLDASESFAIEFVIEELFTNMVKYNCGIHPISVDLEKAGDDLVIRLTDFDVEPFDITKAPEPDLSQPPSMRTPGGLGIHLVRQMADRLSYEYFDRQSRITVVRRLEG